MASTAPTGIQRLATTLSVVLAAIAWPAAQRSGGPGPAAPTTITATGVIRGRVLSAPNGTPIRGAQVRLRDPGGRDYRLATTDDQGQFDVRDLTPGEWTVTASKAGFVSQQAGQTSPLEAPTPVVLANGQRVTVDIQLMRGAAIAGRVTDEYGEPVARASVRAMRARTVRGERQLIPVGIVDQTDDLGAFRVYGLPPGDYYVSATLRSKSNTFLGEMQTVSTYAPGTQRAADAQVIKLQAGQDQPGIDITAPVRTPGVNVSGVVFGSTGAPAPGVEVHLHADDVVAAGAGSKGRFVTTDAGGRFTATSVPPGLYVADATLFPVINPELLKQRATPIIERGMTSFEVGASDVAGVTVTIRPSVTLAGSVVAEIGSTLPREYEVAIRAQPVGASDASPSVAIAVNPGEGGKFSMLNLAGRYVFDITILPEEWMVRRLEVDGRDVTDALVDFSNSAAAATARVVVTDRTARLTGSVSLNGARQASVVIFPDDAAKWKYPSRFVKATRTDSEGRFKFAGLPEERYRAIAVTFLEEDEYLDPEFLERMKDRATELRLSEGEGRTIVLPLSRR